MSAELSLTVLENFPILIWVAGITKCQLDLREITYWIFSHQDSFSLHHQIHPSHHLQEYLEYKKDYNLHYITRVIISRISENM